MSTRSPWVDNMYFVGVPPVDVLCYILKIDDTGKNMVERKRSEVDALLAQDQVLRAEVQRRIDLGQFDVHAVARGMAAKESSAYEESNNCKENLQWATKAKEFLVARLRQQYQEWRERLDTETGLQAMCSVNEGFKFKNGVLAVRTDRKNLWTPLATVLQGDAENKQRIWYYHAVAVEWMQHEMVNALAHAVPGQPRLPKRWDGRPQDHKKIPEHPLNQAVYGYGDAERPSCPQKPQTLQWSTQELGKDNASRSNLTTERPLEVTVSGIINNRHPFAAQNMTGNCHTVSGQIVVIMVTRVSKWWFHENYGLVV